MYIYIYTRFVICTLLCALCILYIYSIIFVIVRTSIITFTISRTMICHYCYCWQYELSLLLLSLGPGQMCCPGKCVLTSQGQCFVRFSVLPKIYYLIATHVIINIINIIIIIIIITIINNNNINIIIPKL